MGKKSRKQRREKEAAARTTGQARTSRDLKATALEYGKAIGTALVIALLLRQFLFQAFTIPTGSMLETLQIGDFLFVNKFLYGAKSPERIRIFKWTLVDGLPHFTLPGIREPRQGDIIVFEFPEDRTQDYIKRCVAVAGDSVRVTGGVLYVNGEIYESNFADLDGDHSCVPGWYDPVACPEPRSRRDRIKFMDGGTKSAEWPWPGMRKPYVVPEGHIFMMGDNRFDSRDSRFWGALDTRLIKGKAMFIYWSWDNGKQPNGTIVKSEIGPRFERIGDLVR